MPLDPRIIASAVSPAQARAPFDPLKAMATITDIRSAQQQQQVNALQLDAAQRAEFERKNLGSAIQGTMTTDPVTGQPRPNIPGALSRAYGTSQDPLALLKLETEYGKTQQEARKAELEGRKAQLEQAQKGFQVGGQVARGIEARIANGQDPQAAWKWGLETMERAGIDTRPIPQTYDANSLAGWRETERTTKEKLDAEHNAVTTDLRRLELEQTKQRTDLDRQRLDLERRRVRTGEQAEERLADQPLATPGQGVQDALLARYGPRSKTQGYTTEEYAQARKDAEQRDDETRALQREKLQLDITKAKRDASGALSPADQRKLSLDLRQNIRQEPSFKIFTQVRNGVQNVEVGAARQDPAGDLAIVNGFAKILDPEGVVRPEEFKTVEASQGFFDRFLNQPGKIWEGDRLRPNVRARFLDAARQLGTEKQATAQKELSTVYEPLARDAGLDFGQVLPLELGQGKAAPTGGTAAPTGGTAAPTGGTAAPTGGTAAAPAGKKRVPAAMLDELARERSNVPGGDFATAREAIRQELRNTGQYEVD
jgi:hypothetical protein